MDESRSETTATGPMANSLELPIMEYIRGGTTLVSGIYIFKLNLIMQIILKKLCKFELKIWTYIDRTLDQVQPN